MFTLTLKIWTQIEVLKPKAKSLLAKQKYLSACILSAMCHSTQESQRKKNRASLLFSPQLTSFPTKTLPEMFVFYKPLTKKKWAHGPSWIAWAISLDFKSWTNKAMPKKVSWSYSLQRGGETVSFLPSEPAAASFLFCSESSCSAFPSNPWL